MQCASALQPASSLDALADSANFNMRHKGLLTNARAIHLINPIVFANIDDPTTKASSSPRFALDNVWSEVEIADVILFGLVNHAETSLHCSKATKRS